MMKKPTWKDKVIILLGFFIGLIINLIARKILPGILPGSWAKSSDFIAMILQILVSGLFVFIPIYIIYSRRER